MAEVPKPDDSGADGNQSLSGEVMPPQPQYPMQGGSVAEVVSGLAASSSRGITGQFGADLLAAWLRKSERDAHELKEELRSTRNDLERIREELAECRVREAVLQQQVGSASSGRHLRNGMIAFGSALFGVSFALLEGPWFLPIILGVGGVAMILMAWLWPSSEYAEKPGVK